MSCDVGEVTERLENERRKSCDVGKAAEGLENELWHRWSYGKVGEWYLKICLFQHVLLQFYLFSGFIIESDKISSTSANARQSVFCLLYPSLVFIDFVFFYWFSPFSSERSVNYVTKMERMLLPSTSKSSEVECDFYRRKGITRRKFTGTCVVWTVATSPGCAHS